MKLSFSNKGMKAEGNDFDRDGKLESFEKYAAAEAMAEINSEQEEKDGKKKGHNAEK